MNEKANIFDRELCSDSQKLWFDYLGGDELTSDFNYHIYGSFLMGNDTPGFYCVHALGESWACYWHGVDPTLEELNKIVEGIIDSCFPGAEGNIEEINEEDDDDE